MSLIVQKFGGSSVANAERVMNVAKIVTETYAKGNDVVVVVSAPVSYTHLIKVTTNSTHNYFYGGFIMKKTDYKEIKLEKGTIFEYSCGEVKLRCV